MFNIDCVAIGDNIAQGVASSLGCSEVRAAPNLTSSRIINIANGNNVYHKYCIISVGTYDTSKSSVTNMQQIRDTSVCKFYVWIKPIRVDKAYEVQLVASKNRDKSVSFIPSSDKTTPASYRDLANYIINITNN